MTLLRRELVQSAGQELEPARDTLTEYGARVVTGSQETESSTAALTEMGHSATNAALLYGVDEDGASAHERYSGYMM